MINCRYCGKENEETNIFCCNCGKKLIGSKRKFIILIISIVVLIAVFAMGVVCYKNMYGVKVVSKTIEAGSDVSAKKLLKPKSKNASLKINGKINTNILGDKKLSYTIRNGMFKVTRKFSVKVVDTTSPVIEGPDVITIMPNEMVDLSLYYTVEDFEDNLNKQIEISPKLSVETEGKKNVVLKVKDSSGNVGKKSVVIIVDKLTGNEKRVLEAINQYIVDGKSRDKILSSIKILKTTNSLNGVAYYIEVSYNTIYAIYYSGEVVEYTSNDAGGETVHDLMAYAVRTNGQAVDSSKLIK